MSWITPVTLNPNSEGNSTQPVNQRRTFRNPRGKKYYYAISADVATRDFYFWKSQDGVTWTKSTFVTGSDTYYKGDPCLWIHEDPGNNRLIVYTASNPAEDTITAEAFTIADSGTDPVSLWTNTVAYTSGEKLRHPSICIAGNGYLWVAWSNLYLAAGKSRTDIQGKASTTTYPMSAPTWSPEVTIFNGSGIESGLGHRGLVALVPLTATANVGIVWKTYSLSSSDYRCVGRHGSYSGAGTPTVGPYVTFELQCGNLGDTLSIVTESGPNSDVFVLYDSSYFLISALWCKKWDVSADTVIAFGTLSTDYETACLSIDRTSGKLYAFWEGPAGYVYFKTSPEAAANWSPIYSVKDDSVACTEPTSSYEDISKEIFVLYGGSSDRWFNALASTSKDLHAEFIIRQGENDLFAKFQISGVTESSKDLFAKLRVIKSDYAELPARLEIRLSGFEDLLSSFQVRAGYQGLFAEFQVRQAPSRLRASIITHGFGLGQRIILQGYGISLPEDVRDLLATFAVRQVKTKALLAKFAVQHSKDLLAKFRVGYPAAQDLKAIFWTSTVWAPPLDLFSQFYIRPEELDAEFMKVEVPRWMVVTGAAEEMQVTPAARQFAVGPEREFKLESPGQFKIGGLERELSIESKGRLQIRRASSEERVRGRKGRRMRVR